MEVATTDLFLPEAAAVALKVVVVVNSPQRVGDGTQAEFNADLGLNTFMNA